MLGATFTAALTTYLVYIKRTSAGESGFLINMAVTFTSMLLWVVSRDQVYTFIYLVLTNTQTGSHSK